MPSIQSLKKELRGIRSTQKLTKAMRTVSTAKFSKLNTIYGQYASYGRQCRQIFDRYQDSFLEAIPAADPNAPPLFLVIASNKGMCGSFNAEILKFAGDLLQERKNVLTVAVGKKAIRYFKGKGLPLEKGYILRDVPSYEESGALLDDILQLRRDGKISTIYVVYPRYTNMLEQDPAVCELFPIAGERVRAGAEEKDAGTDKRDAETGKRDAERAAGSGGEQVLCVPDHPTVIRRTAETLFRSMFYELVLESALGAQASTLMTMRSAYEAATEFCEQLEGQINRKRQSAVTADVIETSSGESMKLGQL